MSGYEGPWLENQLFDHFVERKPHLTRVYLPVAWTDCRAVSPDKIELQSMLDTLDTAYSYFTVSQKPLGQENHGMDLNFPPGLDLLLFSAGGNTSGLPTVPVPLLKEELKPVGYKKSISVSFQGILHRHVIRELLNETYGKYFLFLDSNEDWKHILESSNFSLCPRGYRPSSFWLYEALQLGTIPIIIWEDEKWLPFEETLNCAEFALVVEAGQIANLPELLAAADVPKMQAAVRDVRHRFTYRYTIEYILDTVRQREPLAKGGS